MITIGLVSDKHSGAATGLTSNPRNKIQEKLLKLYKEDCRWLGDVDYLIDLGDVIDGEDLKSRDITEDDISEQVEDAVKLLSMVNAKEYFLLAGTPYHVNQYAQSWDKAVVNALNHGKRTASYHTKLNLEVGGWFNIQARHKIGSSGIPHGRHTAAGRTRTWDAVNAAIKAYHTGKPIKLTNLLVFGHVHYWTYCEDAQAAAMTMPCYQAMGSKFGDMMCDGHIDLGMVKLHIGEKGEWSWEKRLHLPDVTSRTLKR